MSTDSETLSLVNRFARTYQHLWLLIENHPPHCDNEKVARILQYHSENLKKGLDAFPKPDSASRSTLNTGRLSIFGEQITLAKQEREFLVQLSDLIHLDEIHCASLWQSYLRDRVKTPVTSTLQETTTTASSASGTGTGTGKADTTIPGIVFNDDLLDAVTAFYYEERVALVNTVSLLLRVNEDDIHPYREESHNCVLQLCPPDQDNTFADKILAQFIAKAKQPVPGYIADSSSRRSAAWTKQSLHEQKALLELLFLLYYNIIVPAPDRIIILVRDFRDINFGQNQACASHLPGDSETRALHQQITALCTLIAVEILNLESLMVDVILPDRPAGEQLLDSPDQILDLIDIMELLRVDSTTGESPHVAPLLLAWACYLHRLCNFIDEHGCPRPYAEVEDALRGHRVSTPVINPSAPNSASSTPDRSRNPSGDLFRHYVGRAIKLGVLHHLIFLLRSPATLFDPADPIDIGYRSVVKTLLTAFCACFSVQHMQQPVYSAIVDCTALLFTGQGELAAQFWEQDYPVPDRISLLETARARFPVQAGQLVRLLGALSGRGSDDGVATGAAGLAPITGRTERRESVAARSVFHYLAHLPTLTQVIPTNVPADALGFDPYLGTVTAAVPLRLLGNPTAHEQVVPTGTVGRLVSEPGGPRVVQWSLQYSGWHLLTRVLLRFVEAPGIVGSVGDDADPSGGLFLGDESAVPSAEFATEIVELFRGVLADGPEVARALVRHMSDDTDPTTTTSHPTVGLWHLICMVAERASNALTVTPAHAAPLAGLLVACLRCLTALLPLHPRDILSWLHEADLLPRSVPVPAAASRGATTYRIPGRLHELVRGVECVNGRYPLTAAMIGLTAELVVMAVRDRESGATSTQGESSLGDDVRRATHDAVVDDLLIYLRTDLFPAHAGWRYVSIAERYALGGGILRVFEFVMREGGYVGKAKGGIARSRDALVKDFLGTGGAYVITPLLDAVAAGSELVSVGRRARRVAGARDEDMVDAVTALGMMVVRDLLKVRRAGQLMAERGEEKELGNMSLLEHMILERTVGKESVEFVYVLAGFARAVDAELRLPALAAQVLTLLCRLAGVEGAPAEGGRTGAQAGQAPSFVGYFGSPEQAGVLVAAFMGLLSDELRFEETQLSVWGFITAVIETQPGLATLFLSGVERVGFGIEKEIEKKVEVAPPADDKGKTKRKAAEDSGGTAVAMVKGETTIASGSAVRVALNVLAQWQYLLQVKPGVVSAVMRFFAALWHTALDHYSIVRTLRADSNFWLQVQGILFNSLPITTVRRDIEFRIETSDRVDVLVSDVDAEIKRTCADYLARAHALRLVAMEVHLSCATVIARGGVDDSGIGIGVPTKPTTRDFVNSLPQGVRNILKLLHEGNRLLDWRRNFTRTDYDAALNAALKREAEEDQPNKPPVQLDLLRVHAMGVAEDTDDSDRRYGDGYVYDLQRAWRRCGIVEVDTRPDRSADASPLRRRAASRFLGLLCAANHQWSLVDSQLVLLRSYRYFLEVASSRVGEALWAPRSAGTNNLLYPFLNGLARQIAQETRGGRVMMRVRFELSGLLETLVASWVTWKEDDGNKQTRCAEMVVLLQEAIENENFPFADSVNGGVDPPFHRPLFEVLLLCLRGLKGKNAASNASNGGATLSSTQDMDAETAERGMRKSCRSLLPIVCASLTSLLMRSSEFDDYDGPHAHDVRITLSVLQELLRPKCSPHPSMWLPVLQQHETVPTLMRLFAVSVVVGEEEARRDDRETERAWARRKPVYAKSALYTLLALANVPLAAERLAVSGIVELLCDNALSPVLQAGQVTPWVDSEIGTNAVPMGERSEWHVIWCLMLAVIGSLLRSMYDSEQFLESVTSFVQVYGAQFSRALATSSVEASTLLGRFGPDEDGKPTDTGSITTAGLEEIERITVIFFQLSRNAMRVVPIAGTLLEAFAQRGLALLQHYVYFFTHPAHLTARVSPLGREEKVLMARTVAASTGGDAATMTVPLLVRDVRWRLMGIVRNLLVSFVALTDVTAVLTKSYVNWPFNKAIFVPYPKVALDEPASTGTLTDCVTYGVEQLMAWGDLKDAMGSEEASRANLKTVLSMIESGLALMATQLALYLYAPGVDARVKRDIVVESLPDLEMALGKTENVLKKLDGTAAGKSRPVTMEEAREVKRVKEIVGSLKNFISARFSQAERLL